MVLHTSNMRVSFSLRYADYNPKSIRCWLSYKGKNSVKVMDTLRYHVVPLDTATFLYNSKVGLSKGIPFKSLQVEERQINIAKEKVIEEVKENIIFLDNPKLYRVSLDLLYKPKTEILTIDGYNSLIKSFTTLLRTTQLSIDKFTLVSLRGIPVVIDKFAAPITLRANTHIINLSEVMFFDEDTIEMTQLFDKVLTIDEMDTLRKNDDRYLRQSFLDNIAISEDKYLISCTRLDSPIELNLTYYLEKPFSMGMSILENIILHQGQTEMNKVTSIYLRDNLSPVLYKNTDKKLISPTSLKCIDLIEDSKFLSGISRQLDKLNVTKLVRDESVKELFKPILYGVRRITLVFIKGISIFKSSIDTRFLKRINLYYMQEVIRTKLFNGTNLSFIEKGLFSKLLRKQNLLEIGKTKSTKILKRESILELSKTNVTKIFNRLKIFYIFKNKIKLVKNQQLRPINKTNITLLRNISMFNIFKTKEKSIEPRTIYHIKIDNNRFLNYVAMSSIIKENYKTFTKGVVRKLSKEYLSRFLKVTKRWWVLPSGTDMDEKIIPPDYNYLKYPLIGSSELGYIRVVYPNRDENISDGDYNKLCSDLIKNIISNMKTTYYLKNNAQVSYENLPKLYDKHPNSPANNLYIEHDDTNRSIYEIPLSINIMVDMVNLVGLIVHHMASQLCFCTGQEAMWFIMEMIDDWLNLESTQEQLNRLESTEHYYRAYRWIRWEAEKVYFNCDSSNLRYSGLKSGAQLFANLIEYMKNHHFNIVPIWKDLKHMDYWRNQGNKDNNPLDDIPIILDKQKGKRYLNIETQRLDKKAIEGMPKIKKEE